MNTVGLLLSKLVVLMPIVVGQAQVSPESAKEDIASTSPSELTLTLSVPLEDGQFDLGTVLGVLLDHVGLDGDVARQNIDVKFDVAGTAAKLQLGAIHSMTRGVVWFETQSDRLAIHLDRLRWRREEKQLRSRLRNFFEKLAPERAAMAALRYGMVVYQDEDQTVKPDKATFSQQVVVLVHGLDEPGHLWVNLIPQLLAANMCVVEFRYPNDQAIESSADLLVDHLKQLRSLGVERLSLVTHSMGGLVSRWVLTDSDAYAGQGSGHATLPDVSELIMVGAPQHGSRLVRLRLFVEARDQISRMLSGDGMLFGSIFDGAGEAKVDLLPGSEFLTQLNARPHPEHVAMTIIAGKASPVTREQLDQMAQKLRPYTSDDTDAGIDTAIDAIARLQDGLGDGAVSLESAHLEGVDDFVVLPANHLTIIRNFLPNSEHIPLAVPVILDRLSQDKPE